MTSPQLINLKSETCLVKMVSLSPLRGYLLRRRHEDFPAKMTAKDTRLALTADSTEVCEFKQDEYNAFL